MEDKYDIPMICLPLTGKNKAEISKQLQIIIPKEPDLIELRADFLEDISDNLFMINLIEFIKDKTNLPLLFTIRSAKEGGEIISLNEADVFKLVEEICLKTEIEYIDYEVDGKLEYVEDIVKVAKDTNKKIILSYHNFQETPPESDLIDKIKKMKLFDANYAKIAVMPNERRDVFNLLNVTAEATELLEIPLITMSMGELGKLTRVIGWTYGSRVTFAIGAATSAPGQIEIDHLRESIKKLKEVL